MPSSECSSSRSSTGSLLFDLEVERPLTEPRRGRRAEEVRALERAVRLAEVRERRLGDRREQLERVGKRVGSDRPAAPLLPSREERLEHLVKKLSALLRAQAGLVFPFLVQAQHVRREVLERTREVALDVADRVDIRRRADPRRRGTPHRRPAIVRRAARATRRPPPPQTTATTGAAGLLGTIAIPRRSIGSPLASISSRNDEPDTIASSSSVNVETDTRRRASLSRS